MKLTQLIFGLKGRIGRATWWVGAGAAALLAIAVNTAGSPSTPPRPGQTFTAYLSQQERLGEAQSHAFPLVAIVLLVCLFISVTFGVKRCHDRNKSGWFLLLGLIPILGWIWLFIELGCLPGSPGSNRYGLAQNQKPGPDRVQFESL